MNCKLKNLLVLKLYWSIQIKLQLKTKPRISALNMPSSKKITDHEKHTIPKRNKFLNLYESKNIDILILKYENLLF